MEMTTSEISDRRGARVGVFGIGLAAYWPQFPELRARLEFFQRERDLYRKRQWEEAQKTFQAILDKWPTEGPSRTYWKRCQEYLFDEPPSGWDGVFVMTHK